MVNINSTHCSRTVVDSNMRLLLLFLVALIVVSTGDAANNCVETDTDLNGKLDRIRYFLHSLMMNENFRQ